MSAVEMERAVRKAVDSYNRRDLDFIDELYDKGFLYHGNGEMMAAFPDMHIHVDEIFTSGDRLCYRMTVSGTHKGELLGLPTTNRKISIRTIGIMRFRDGKIVEEWENYDELGMLRQLGAIQD
ncbi:MAG: ester cyclase [Nitrososphaerota archaeon]